MNKLFIMIILAGILLFGCLGQPSVPSGGGAGTGGTGTGTGGGAGTGGTGATGAGGGVGGAGTGATGGGGGGTGGGVVDAAAYTTYAAAMEAGIPLSCTVIIQGEATQIDIKGGNMYLIGTSAGQPYEMVLKSDTAYLKLSDEMKSTFASLGKTCDWLVFKTDTSMTGSDTAPVTMQDLQAQDVSWVCVPGLFGDERFATPGSTCTMEDLTAGYGAK